ncbi:3-deoxy-D-manno-oct-2-ulosonic acid (Kdo) hydroxylase [Rhodoferax koreense]|uniref:3-deoxy-D-manno-oct-2-ulosonic acid (Kdo) hydroxylase n=1 Tax=Rhodoferax koreensis TaxID=1842727 RepID=A0A1P8K3X9_9BURK|nr:Kdo hydroxylase family protein [Rhodoferax koreense]APW40702.1 3-deoxy-D-manno-oct-2-ulosonic acid (Kdo) hydroxylase [Rhodoferax koreense]
MQNPIVEVPATQWHGLQADPQLTAALEDGGVMYFPALPFSLSPAEAALLRPEIRDPKSRNISQPAGQPDTVKGALATPEELATLAAMMLRYRNQAVGLIGALFPGYSRHLRLEPTSYRPSEVETRQQSWRADDKRLHVDAFPSRPNRGERILRVFSNLNPAGKPRLWRVGEPFETMAARFLPQVKPYRPWQAALLRRLRVTKSLRSEYDHLMLQLHDLMKQDLAYQRDADQLEMPFAAGSTWVCFSDQTLHAVYSGQFMMEQTFFMAPQHQTRPERSPLGILTRMAGRPLAGAPL